MTTFKTIVIDPPWPGPGGCPTFDRHKGICLLPYRTMTGVQVSALRVRELASEDAQLFIWTTSRNLGDAFLLLEEWAFFYRGLFIWLKRLGLGRHMRSQCEFLLWGGRIGSPLVEPKHCPRQVQEWAKPKGHSVKPPEAFEFIAGLSLEPRIELFARTPHPGFEPWGDEVCKEVAL